LILLVVAPGCQPQPEAAAPAAARSTEWIHSVEVLYKENHDPSMIWLADGRELQVVYGRPSLEDVDQWKPGRTLRLAFSAATGPVLIDPETMGRLPVIGGLERDHPLDLLLRQNLEHSPDTISIGEAYRHNTARWLTEIGRLQDELTQPDHIPEEVRASLRAAGEGWTSFREQQVRAAGALLDLPSGTMWRIRQAEHAHRVAREHALLLMTLRDAVDSARPEDTSPPPAPDQPLQPGAPRPN
jgi:hypothetical protein